MEAVAGEDRPTKTRQPTIRSQRAIVPRGPNEPCELRTRQSLKHHEYILPDDFRIIKCYHQAMTNYLLRDIPPDLWRQAKRKAQAEGHTLKWLVLRWLKQYVAGQLIESPRP
jgi:hypothetical protein